MKYNKFLVGISLDNVTELGKIKVDHPNIVKRERYKLEKNRGLLDAKFYVELNEKTESIAESVSVVIEGFAGANNLNIYHCDGFNGARFSDLAESVKD